MSHCQQATVGSGQCVIARWKGKCGYAEAGVGGEIQFRRGSGGAVPRIADGGGGAETVFFPSTFMFHLSYRSSLYYRNPAIVAKKKGKWEPYQSLVT